MSFGQRKLDREKPEIDFPEGEAPTELVITDLKSSTRRGTAASRCPSRWALAR